MSKKLTPEEQEIKRQWYRASNAKTKEEAEEILGPEQAERLPKSAEIILAKNNGTVEDLANPQIMEVLPTEDMVYENILRVISWKMSKLLARERKRTEEDSSGWGEMRQIKDMVQTIASMHEDQRETRKEALSNPLLALPREQREQLLLDAIQKDKLKGGK